MITYKDITPKSTRISTTFRLAHQVISLGVLQLYEKLLARTLGYGAGGHESKYMPSCGVG